MDGCMQASTVFDLYNPIFIVAAGSIALLEEIDLLLQPLGRFDQVYDDAATVDQMMRNHVFSATTVIYFGFTLSDQNGSTYPL